MQCCILHRALLINSAFSMSYEFTPIFFADNTFCAQKRTRLILAHHSTYARSVLQFRVSICSVRVYPRICGVTSKRLGFRRQSRIHPRVCGEYTNKMLHIRHFALSVEKKIINFVTQNNMSHFSQMPFLRITLFGSRKKTGDFSPAF